MGHHWAVDTPSILLLVLRDGQPVKAVAVGDRGAHLGRGRDADISLVDERVSVDHARVWTELGRLLIRDLGSRNGTFVNGVRIHSVTELSHDDELRLGPETRLRVRVLGGVQSLTALTLVERDAGVRTPLHEGDNEIDELLIRVDREGDVWLMGVPSRQLQVGEAFEVGDRHFVVEVLGDRAVRTAEVEGGVPPVRVEVRLDGPTGPEARFIHLRDTSKELRISAATQAEVVYVLAKELSEGRAAGTAEPGWISNSDLRHAVWGRQADRLHRSRLPVVLHRIRKALESAGFPDDCIGRRRGGSRLFVAEVQVR